MAAIQDWQVRGPGGGGALFSPSINPANGNEIYIASDMTQVFRTTNEGAAWSTVNFNQIKGGHESKVQFTKSANRRYVLDYTDPSDSGGTRLMQSSNAGNTWAPLASDPTGGEAITLWADYNRPNRLIVNNYSNLWLSNDGGQTWQLKFSTADGGGMHVGGVFFDGPRVYIGTNQGLLRSQDNGVSFSVASLSGIPATSRIVSFAGAKENGVTRFWAVAMNEGDVYGGVQGWDHFGYQGVYTVTLGQGGWKKTTTGIGASDLPFYVSAATNDIDTVYVSGGDDNSNPIVFKSTTGGQSWTSVFQTNNNANIATGWSGDGGNREWSYGETALGFTVSPLDASRIIITDYGFGHLSDDGGSSWRALYVNPADLNPANTQIPITETYRSSGLENTTSWQVAWADSTHLVGAFSDIRGAVSTTSGNSWSFDYSGHTDNSLYRVAVHPTNGNIYGATGTVHDLYQSTYLTDARIDGGDGKVIVSADQGHTWSTLHDFGHVVSWVALDPTNPNRMYASVVHSTQGGIYVSNNIQSGASSTWTKLANPPRTQGHPFNINVLKDGTIVVSYSGRRDAAGFTASSGVFVSTNGGQTWLDRSDAGMRYWTKDIVIDPHDASQKTWYAAVFSGWGGAPNGLGGVYRTTNRGVSWTRINALDRVESITISPTNANEAYITTETQGLWYTSHLRATTPTFFPVKGYAFSHPTRVYYNPNNTREVWVTSFGGGLRVGTVPQAAPALITSSATATPQTSASVTASSQPTTAPSPRSGDTIRNRFQTASSRFDEALLNIVADKVLEELIPAKRSKR